VRKAEADALLAREGAKRYALAGGLCERCKARRPTARHHVVRRSQHVDHRVENLRVLCLWCHEHVHANVAESKEQGWIKSDRVQVDSMEGEG
jgi:hypothetical protein